MRALVCACALLAGCLDDALGIPLDGGLDLHADLTRTDALPVDLAGVDLAHAPTDLATGCTHLASWPATPIEVRGSPTESPFDYVTWARALDGTTELSVEVWHRPGTPGTPYTLALPGDTNYLLCEVCVLVDLHYDASRGYGDPGYLALSGTVTVSRADTASSSGELEVSGSDVRLVEWDFLADAPRAGGGCFLVDTFALSGHYSGDGGDPPRWK